MTHGWDLNCRSLALDANAIPTYLPTYVQCHCHCPLSTENTYFVRGNITVWLTSYFICLDSAALLPNELEIDLLVCSNPNRSNRSSAIGTVIQWYFPLQSRWVFIICSLYVSDHIYRLPSFIQKSAWLSLILRSTWTCFRLFICPTVHLPPLCLLLSFSLSWGNQISPVELVL